jgi:hypothetical protein
MVEYESIIQAHCKSRVAGYKLEFSPQDTKEARGGIERAQHGMGERIKGQGCTQD